MEVRVRKIDLDKLMMAMRQDVRKKFCSIKEACYILDLKKDSFYNLLKDGDTKIRRTKIKGKYLLESIYEEEKRLTI